jgi:hypothetical protein
MNSIQCKVKDCKNVYLTEEAVSPNARFICREHPRQAQVEAVGRKYNPVTDEADNDIHFQGHQFDKDLRIARMPIGTSHIPNHGSNVITSDELQKMYPKEENGE